jgi:GNAT superfamily N-acetyltransferase
MSLVVRVAEPDEIRPLRLAVLRPDSPPRPPTDYDLDPATVHVGAFDDGTAVGCASVFPDPYPDEPKAWRLRGMAVDAGHQGRGIGRKVLERAVAAADAAGAPLLWANGRVTALGFYERLGWVAVGEVFPSGPAALPHRVILLQLCS